MPELFGTGYTRAGLLRRVGRLEQVAGVRLITIGDGQGRGVRILEFRTGTGFAFDVLIGAPLLDFEKVAVVGVTRIVEFLIAKRKSDDSCRGRKVLPPVNGAPNMSAFSVQKRTLSAFHVQIRGEGSRRQCLPIRHFAWTCDPVSGCCGKDAHIDWRV